MGTKINKIALKATWDNGPASKGLKGLAAMLNKTSKEMIGAESKIQKSNVKGNTISKKKLSASKMVAFAMAKEAAGSDKVQRKIVALNLVHERAVAKMRKLAKAGKPIPRQLAHQASASRKAAIELRKLAAQSGKAARGLGKLSKVGGLAAIGVGVAALGAMYLAMRKLARGIRESVKRSIEFNESINEVMTIADKAQFSISGVKKVTLDLAKSFGVKASEQAAAMYQAISGGANTAAKATAILTNANRLAVSGVTDVKTATDGLLNVTNVWASGDGAIGAARAADIMQAAIKQGKTTAEELSTELGNVNSIARASGLSFEEVAAAVATITTKGVTTGQAVTQLRSALVAMTKDTSKSADEAERLFGDRGAFGLSAMKAAGGLVPFLRKIAANSKTNEKTWVALFGRIEGVNAAMNLVATDGGAKYDETLKAVTMSHGEVEQAMQIMQSSFGFQTQKNEALRDSFMITFGEAVTGSEAAKDSVGVLNDFTAEMTELFATPEGRAAVNEFFVIMAQSAQLGLQAIKFVIDGIDAMRESFKDSMVAAGLLESNFNAMPLAAAQGADTAAAAFDKLIWKLGTVGDRAKETSDKERRAAIETNKAYEAAFAARIAARGKAAAAARKSMADVVAAERKAAATKTKLAQDVLRAKKQANKQAADDEKSRLAGIVQAHKDAATRRGQIVLDSIALWERQRQTKLDREMQDMKTLDDKITEFWTKVENKVRSGLSAMRGAWSESFDQVGRLQNESVTEIVRNEEGLLEERERIVGQHIQTSADAFADFLGKVGEMVKEEVLNYLIMKGVQMLADKAAAMFGIGVAAAEGGAKAVKAHAGIPFIGLAIGAAAAAGVVALAMSQGDKVGTPPALPKGFASGGFVTGATGVDRIPAWLSAGEFVIPKDTVDQIRRGAGPAQAGSYATGGAVTGGGGSVNVTLATSVPQDRATLRRWVRDVLTPELRASGVAI